MRALIVEDEPLMAESIKTMLDRAAIVTDVVHDGLAALAAVDENDYDVIVLDRDLPGMHGDEVCRRIIDGDSAVRILMLTAARRLDDRIAGFELGADDYLAKPFEPRELVARLRALERRATRPVPPTIVFGDVVLNPFRREVTRAGHPRPLSRKEFAVLEVLMRAEGGVVSAEQLLERAWDRNANPFTNSIRVTVSNLRKKLGEPWIVKTVPGFGYRMEEGGA
ncbi:response regulator transcription factor [Lacisediminihabitans changchengi]|uniref:Response regulator transcription factor n=1 Tax=Lacisediminihabitans changchengi TaxID=2787634 RepID=A0A934VZ62_9MICO|nr:response regulator transcription factor [Lacisediminihabitans changchengi]MBK4348797.1 response regulator transcription factor [Lacisediminihabitans changchengi]